MTASQPQHNVAVMFSFFAHYREAIMRRLCRQERPGPRYTLIAGLRTNVPGLKIIDPALAARPVAGGGLRWRIVRNFWLRNVYLWQTRVIRTTVSREFDTLIYFGHRGIVTTWISVLLARLLGKRTLFWGHAFRQDRSGPRGLSNLWFQKLPHGLLLVGNRARRIALAHGFRDETLYVVFNALDYDAQKHLRETIAPQRVARVRTGNFDHPDRPLLVTTARLDRRKRLDMLIDAVQRLADGGVDVNVLIVGDGESRAELAARIERLHLADRVKLPGACHDEDELCAMYSAADLCVIPGAAGLTVMHAMVYGTPVITHDDPDDHGPEFEAILPGRTGAFFRRDDTDDLARAIADWLAAQTRRDAVRQECQRVIDTWYTPAFQAEIINAAVAGTPATDLPRGEGPYAG